MSKLRISLDLALPPDVVTSTLVVYGGKGMGKTNLGSVLIEELTKAGLRWCLLDPMGVSWGLRYSSDGKGPGVECVILGGAHGDIPIEPTGGAIVADLVVDENVNTIIDFSRKANGQMWTLGEKVRFVTDYTLRLFQRQGELVDGRRREPLMQILDEAARYIPQVIPHGAIDLARCVGAWEQVCEEGRNIGLGVAFLTQRSARMNKSVSELADVMFAFRTIGPNSLAAVMDWLGEHVEKGKVRDLASKVRELEVGHALVVSPGWLKVEKIAHIRVRETFDSSATPKAGQTQKRVTGKAAKPDLAKYHERMAATIEKAKADDPKALRAEIASLKKQVAAKMPTGKVVANPDMVTRQAMASQVDAALAWAKKVHTREVTELCRVIDRLVSGSRRAIVSIEDLCMKAGKDVEQIGRAATESGAGVRETSRASTSGMGLKERETRPLGRVAPVPPSRRPSDASLSGAKLKIARGLAELEALGVTQVKRAQLSFYVGLTFAGGYGSNTLGAMRTEGLLDYPTDGYLALTPDGRAAVGEVDPPTSLDDLHQRVRRHVSGLELRIFDAVIPLGQGGAVTREDLAQQLGVTFDGGYGSNTLGALRTAGIIDYPTKGSVGPSDLLFPEGLS